MDNPQNTQILQALGRIEGQLALITDALRVIADVASRTNFGRRDDDPVGH